MNDGSSAQMDHPMQDAPSDVLADARRTLEALKSSGLSREVLLQMWEAGDRSSQSSSETVVDDASTRGASSTLPTTTTPTPTTLTSAPPPPGICHGQVGHRPRISVSSTSSGSSGHASIWSMGSVNSNASAATHYSQPSQPGLQRSVSVSGLSASASAHGWGPGRSNFYWCTSCETRFKRKYDWKRHEEEFHERWKKYPCPEPGCNRSFWGANTFNQHHKSSHGCKTCPHSEKVVRYLKRRKYWACGFCSALHPSRERHVEHVARHFESGKTKSDWMHSRVIYGLLHQPLLHEAWKDMLMSKASEFAGRQPNFSWNPTQTGRAQGFMENECPGQLQDLLEFFAGSSSEAESIVSLAYDQSDLVFINVPASPPMDFAPCYPQPPTGLAPPPPSAPSQHTQQHQQAFQPPRLLSPAALPSHTLPTQHSPTTPVLPSQQGGAAHHSYLDQTGSQPQQMDHQMGSLSPQPQMEQQQQHVMTPMYHTPSYVASRGSAEPLRRSSLDRELPPPPQEAQPMHFSYMGPPIVFQDWQGFDGTIVEDQSHTPTPVSAEWPLMPVQYYDTPVRQ